MKNLLFLLLTTPAILCSQFNNRVLSHSQIETVSVEVPIEGTPFMNPTYKQGETIISGKSKTKALMRYNAYYDSIELLDENNTPRKLLRRKSIHAIFDGKTYQIFEYDEAGKKREGYFNPLNIGEVKLLFKPKKMFVQAKKPEHGYDQYKPPTFQDISSHYVIIGESTAIKTRLSKKQILKHLDKNTSQIRKLISNQKLNLQKEADVITLIDYYNTLHTKTAKKNPQS